MKRKSERVRVIFDVQILVVDQDNRPLTQERAAAAATMAAAARGLPLDGVQLQHVPVWDRARKAYRLPVEDWKKEGRHADI